VTVTGVNTFTVTQASRTTSGNVTLVRSTIRASGNVSSVADNAAGDYTVNFATAMPDANYAISGLSGAGSSGSTSISGVNNSGSDFEFATGSVRIRAVDASGNTAVDCTYVSLSIFR
jgi:hypothetical protein